MGSQYRTKELQRMGMVDKKKKLILGESPFDKMDRSELELAAKMLYIATERQRDLLCRLRGEASKEPVWLDGGEGQDALAWAEQALECGAGGYSQEDVRVSWGRFALSVFFNIAGRSVSTWMICPVCNRSYGIRNPSSGDVLCRRLGTSTSCPGVLRKVTHLDLKTGFGHIGIGQKN